MEVSGPHHGDMQDYCHPDDGLTPAFRRQLNHMLHLRRKAEIQNLDNINHAARTHGMDPALDFQLSALTRLPSRDVNDEASSSQAFSTSLRMTSAATSALIGDQIDVQLDALPQLSGLYVYVKAKLTELIDRPTA